MLFGETFSRLRGHGPSLVHGVHPTTNDASESRMMWATTCSDAVLTRILSSSMHQLSRRHTVRLGRRKGTCYATMGELHDHLSLARGWCCGAEMHKRSSTSCGCSAPRPAPNTGDTESFWRDARRVHHDVGGSLGLSLSLSLSSEGRYAKRSVFNRRMGDTQARDIR